MKQRYARFIRRSLKTLGIYDFAFRSYHGMMDYYLQTRYGKTESIQVNLEGKAVTFSTKDNFSKRLFMPQFANGTMYEEPVTRLITEKMLNSHCFADVGAHVGYYTCVASKLMNNGQIFSFEMDGDNYALLIKNIGLNDYQKVKAVQAAVSNTVGTTEYVKHRKGSSSGFSLSYNPERDSTHGNLVKVETITLDNFFKEQNSWPDLIKIDVEGAELKVLQGADQLLQNANPIIFVEVHPDKLTDFQATAQDVITLLLQYNYKVSEISNKDGKATLVPLNSNSMFQQNAMLIANK